MSLKQNPQETFITSTRVFIDEGRKMQNTSCGNVPFPLIIIAHSRAAPDRRENTVFIRISVKRHCWHQCGVTLSSLLPIFM